MSQVNFVEQFNLFMRYSRANKLTSYERIFYLGLFHCANDLARQTEDFEWPDDYFPVSNVELNGWTGFDERAIRNTRNSLKLKGLLDFRKGDGKKSDPTYRIFYLRKTGYKIAPDVPKEETTGSENAGGQGIGGENAGGLNGPGAKTQAVKTTDCEFAPDCAGDPVGDPVGDPAAIGCENAGEHFIKNKPNVNANPNANTTAIPATEKTEEKPAAKTQAEAAYGANPELGRVMSFYMDHFATIPPQIAIAGLTDYTASLSADVVIHAMEIALAERKMSWSYLRGILNRYHREGLNNMPAVLQSEQRYDENKARSAAKKSREQEKSGRGPGLVDMSAGYTGGGLVPGLRAGRW